MTLPNSITPEGSRRALSAVISEFMFIILPIAVTAYVFFKTGQLDHLHHSPEWSFAAVILAGQTSAKLFLARSLRGTKLQIVAVFVFFIAVVAVLVLSSVLTDEVLDKEVSHFDSWLQIGLFAGTSAVFLIFGTLAHAVSENP